MSVTEKKNLDLRFLPRAFCAWLICAAALLLSAAVLYASGAASLSTLGYCSSLISFLAALGAGIAATRGCRDKRLLLGVLTALCLSAPLLLTGFLIKGSLEGSAVLSVCCFTLVGCLLGSIIRVKRKRGGKLRPKPGRRG